MKRIYLFILILVSLNAGAQTVPAYFSPIASPYEYQWLRARYLRIPTAAQTGADAGSIYYNATDSSVKVWTGYNYINVGIAGGGGSSYFAGYGLNLSGTTFKADTLALSTRLWRNKGLDSLAAVIGTNYYNKAASDGRYALLGHTHTASQITDFTTVGRNLYTGGTGIDVNNTTGVISFTGGGSGTYLFSAPLNESGGTVSITQANGSTNGYLSAVDWTLFNGKVSQDALDDTAATLRALIAAATPDSFTYATRRYVDSSVSALSGDFINNSTTQQTANFNITGNGVMGGNLDATGSGTFAQNRVQLSHATLGGATKWYNTSGDLYSEVNPDQGGYMSSRRFVFNSAVGDPTAGTDYKGYLYMKSGVPYWSYNGTHTAIPLSSGATLPDQTGNAGKYLTTDGTDASWGTISNTSSFYNVRDYGALGDNATNDGASIDSAIATLSAAGGGTLYFPKGTYRTSALLTIPANCRVLGDGAGVSKIINTDGNSTIVVLSGDNSSMEGMTIGHLTLTDRTTSTEGIGVYVAAKNVVVRNCEVYHSVIGILVGGNKGGAEDCSITNNYVHHTDGDGIAIFGYTADKPNKRISVIGNHVEDSGDDSYSCNTYTDNGVAPNEDVVIMGNTSVDSRARGICVLGARNVNVVGNTVRRSFLAGIIIGEETGFAATENIIVKGNNITDAGQGTLANTSVELSAGIGVQNRGGLTITGVTIEGNHIQNPQGNYIAVFNKNATAVQIKNISIRGNTCAGGNDLFTSASRWGDGNYAGIYVNDTRNVDISGNHVSDALHDGILVGDNVTGAVKVLENTVEDANLGCTTTVAGISISSGLAIVRHNVVSDTADKVINAIYLSSALAAPIGVAADNHLGGRAFTTTAAGSGAGCAGDVTAPTISSITTASDTTITATFSESVTVTTDGWQFIKEGSANPITSLSGAGATWTFTLTNAMSAGETLKYSYDPPSGNTVDAAGNELALAYEAAITNSLAGGGSTDSDATYYITQATSAGYTFTGTQSQAIHDFVIGAKAQGLWTKLVTFYPILPAVTAANLINLKTPGTYDATMTGSPSFGASGVSFPTTSDFLTVGARPYETLTWPSISFGLYSHTNDATGIQIPMGVTNSGNYLQLNLTSANGIAGTLDHIASYTPSDTRRMHIVSRTSTTDLKVYQDGTQVGSETTAETGNFPTAHGITIGHRNDAGVAAFNSNHTVSSIFMASGLSATEAANLTTLINALETAFGRNVP